MIMDSRIKKQAIEEDAIVQRDPDQEFTMIDDEVVMLSLKNGEYYALDPVGSRIWEILKEPVEVRLLVRQLINEFDVNEVVCKQETIQYLSELKNKDLLK
uniref:PqqD family peptide modification chaperone n=1 Tax=Candidatus Electrothrix sp. TaxID=2170559 RepID=UPI004056AC2B